MFPLNKKTNNFLNYKKSFSFWRFFLSIRTVFLLFLVFFTIFVFSQKIQAQPVESGMSVSATVEGGAPTPPPSGGGSVSGTITYYANVVFKGAAYPNAFIAVMRNNVVAKTGLADSSGNFSLKLTGIPVGVWQFGLYAEDEENRKSPTLNFTISLNRDTTTTFSNIFFPPTIELNANNIYQGGDLDIFGYSASESEMTVFINSLANISKTVQADEKGKWLYSFDSSVLSKEGNYSVKAKVVSPQGLVSEFSNELSFYMEAHPCSGVDLNHDNKVNMVDFSILLYWWGKSNTCADQNKDGIVNLTDFSIMMYFWTG